MQSRFFAYGSFSQGQVHHQKIKQFVVGQRQAFFKGEAFRLRCGYPALLPMAEGGELIEGVLYDLETPESYWSVIDGLLGVDQSRPEKCLFNRITAEVRVDNFSRFQAQVYCLNPKKKLSAHKKITRGEWKRNLLMDPPISVRLEERQKQYILKLANSRGRDIVPIKLDLYRELMNLELIVDKGRRLALTPLGKEAAHFMEL